MNPGNPEMIAYEERKLLHPETGEEGIIRKEWRVRKINQAMIPALEETFGPSEYWGHRYATHVVETRIIKHGKEGPWEPNNLANSITEACQECEGKIPVHPTMIKIRAEQEEYARQRKEEQEKERQVQNKNRERAEHLRASQGCFRRFRTSNPEMADAWNAWIKQNMEKGRG